LRALTILYLIPNSSLLMATDTSIGSNIITPSSPPVHRNCWQASRSPDANISDCSSVSSVRNCPGCPAH
jgi:hypothetical protein